MDKLTERVLEALESLSNSTPNVNEVSHIADQLGAISCNGATRWAFVFKKQRVVYKFPRYESCNKDYCEIEAENYALAKDYRVEKICLPIEQVGSVLDGELRVYKQPMFDIPFCRVGYRELQILEAKTSNLNNKDIVQNVRQEIYDYTCIDRLWLRRAIQIYGKQFMRSFEKWTQDARINDLHMNNVGFLGKRPIIIDYAGYHEDSYDSSNSW